MRKLSVIIPIHNEAATVAEIIKRVITVALPGWQKEIIALDDGSTDETWQRLTELKQQNLLPPDDLILLRHDNCQGKGAAIRAALRNVGGDYVVIQDADLEYFPEDLPKLLSAISLNGNTAVFGKRGVKAYPQRGLHYVAGAKLLTWFFDLLFWQTVSDLYTGYKLLPAARLVALNCVSSGFEFEAEVACRLVKAGLTIVEVPIHYQPRSKAAGKHIRFSDAMTGFWTILKYRVK